MKGNNLILNAVMSKLVSQRDDILAQLDLVLNKNISDKGISNIVEQATNLFAELSKIETTIETTTNVIENSNRPNQFAEQLSEIKNTISKIQENNNNTQNDGDNS